MIKYRNKKVIEDRDWDKLVKDTYGKPYNFQQQDGCQSRGNVYLTVYNEPYREEDDPYPDNIPFKINGSKMGVKFTTWLNTTEESINEKHPESYPNANRLFWQRNFYPDLQIVANDLCTKGLIEAGDYTINIDW